MYSVAHPAAASGHFNEETANGPPPEERWYIKASSGYVCDSCLSRGLYNLTSPLKVTPSTFKK